MGLPTRPWPALPCQVYAMFPNTMGRPDGIRWHQVGQAGGHGCAAGRFFAFSFGTTRITLNDNLLNRSSLASIEAVMGHEMGHYVLNHVYKMLVFMSVLVVLIMSALRWSLDHLLARFGARWGISGPGDLAVLPLAVALISACSLVATPITNTLVRTQEIEADVFGLNAAREPDGFAEAALQLSEYRKMEPSPIEEFIFFDHPSGATRIRTAMRWKAENLTQGHGASVP